MLYASRYMVNNAYIFIGRSGCGKGTQVALLKKFLEEQKQRSVFLVTTGDALRTLWKEDGYTARLSRAINEHGGLQPEFIAAHAWTHVFIEGMREGHDVFVDGSPRRVAEAHVLGSALEFYKLKTFIIHIDVSREWAKNRLLARKRGDDTEANIDGRLDWFENNTLEAVEYLANNPAYTFCAVNGEQAIDVVHKEILAKTGFSS